jgi:hypothetical protein
VLSGITLSLDPDMINGLDQDLRRSLTLQDVDDQRHFLASLTLQVIAHAQVHRDNFYTNEPGIVGAARAQMFHILNCFLDQSSLFPSDAADRIRRNYIKFSDAATSPFAISDVALWFLARMRCILVIEAKRISDLDTKAMLLGVARLQELDVQGLRDLTITIDSHGQLKLTPSFNDVNTEKAVIQVCLRSYLLPR